MRRLIPLLMVLITTSCASGPSIADRIVAPMPAFAPAPSLQRTISVGSVTNETGLLDLENVVNASDFEDALSKALSKSTLAAPSGQTGPYRLDVKFAFATSSPRFLDHTLTLDATYSLVQVSNNQLLASRTITTTDTLISEARRDYGVIGGLLLTNQGSQRAQMTQIYIAVVRQNIGDYLATLRQ